MRDFVEKITAQQANDWVRLLILRNENAFRVQQQHKTIVK